MLNQAQLLKNYLSGRKNETNTNLEQDTSGAKVISVTSGKGGVGKTNFTVNFAIELAKRGNRVLIIDADFGLSNIDVILGVTPKNNLSSVLRREKHLVEVVNEGPFGVKFIAGGSGVYDLLALNGDDIEYFLNEMMSLEKQVDTIIFDTGAGINENNVQLIQASHEVILVTTPEPTSLVDAYALAKTLIRVEQDAKIRLVVNRAESAEEAEKVANNFSGVTYSYLNTKIEKLGYILDDANVVKAVKMQRPFVLNFPNSNAAKNVVHITTRFLNVETKESKSGLKAFFKKMLKK